MLNYDGRKIENIVNKQLAFILFAFWQQTILVKYVILGIKMHQSQK
jgi:hypothetical protein